VKAAVTGATGYLGRFIVEKLFSEGVEVRAWRRPSSDLRGLPEEMEWVDGGLDVPGSDAALLDGADMLVHAALDHAPGRYRGGEGDDLQRFLRVNVGGSLSLLTSAHSMRVERCVVISSRAVFGNAKREGKIPDDAPLAPDTHYGAAKAALEAFVQSFAAREGWAIAALRPTGIYGLVQPPEKSKWFDLVRAALRGKPVASRAGSEVHGRDVADSVWRLLTAAPESIAGRGFNCSDLVISTRDIVREVHRVAGPSGPLPEEPSPLTNVMACNALEKLGVRFGGRPLFEQTIAALVSAAPRPDA
jgi:nucleoside-diphosphate-sugar epimerase